MEYYNSLSRVEKQNNLAVWFTFFLKGVIETSKKATKTFDSIQKLRKRVKETIQQDRTRSNTPQIIVDQFYKKPVMSAQEVSEQIELSLPTINSGIKKLVDLKLLSETTGKSRGKVYLFHPYIELFQ